MKAIVDADLCTGCNQCVETCPEVFEMGDDDVAVVIADEVPAEAEETCQQAADDCPAEAIIIED
ncbi:MAG: ferredoxin [Planctomycetota bacterium]|jgi:ferredoxin